MPRLLVSVRNAEEAAMALEGGADLIDIKEPTRGPLGRADESVWGFVLDRVPPWVPVSAALGELGDCSAASLPAPGSVGRLRFLKLGLSHAPPDWADRCLEIRDRLGRPEGWIAVIYADWHAASAPAPDDIVAFALRESCAGILVDTWSKSQPAHFHSPAAWRDLLGLARLGGLRVALAGGLDLSSIGRLQCLDPDYFAVRSAACAGGDRLGPIVPEQVAELALAVRGVDRPPNGFEGCPASYRPPVSQGSSHSRRGGFGT